MSRNVLNMKQHHSLVTFTLEEYSKHNLNDTQFAELSSERLKFPVTDGNIKGIRKEFGIVSSTIANARSKKNPFDQRLYELEMQVADLTTRFETLLRRLGS